MKKYFTLFMFLITAQSVFSAEELTQDVKNMLKSGAYEPNMLSVLLALIFVVCLIYITGLIYTKLNVIGAKTVKKHLKDYDETKIIVHSTKPIGQHRTLHVVEVNGKRLLIGSAPNSIHLIKDLTEDVKKNKKVKNEESWLEPETPEQAFKDNEEEDKSFLDKLYQSEEDGVYKKYL